MRTISTALRTEYTSMTNLLIFIYNTSPKKNMAFSALFYQKLIIDRPESVHKWTSRLKYIFSQHLLLLPINCQQHWSLCVVINPVSNPSLPHPSILSLESLSPHKADIITAQTRNWINYKALQYYCSPMTLLLLSLSL